MLEGWPSETTIRRELQDPLALKILQGEFRDGETIRVDAAANGEALTFTPVVEGEAVPA